MLTFSVLGWIGITMILMYLVMGFTESTFEPINMRYVPIDLLHHHPENPRDKKRYSKEDTEFKRTQAQMVNGWDYDHPAAIISNADGRYPNLPRNSYRVLVGNRRLAVAKHRGIERVPCVIVEGLSRAEEIRRLHDHAGVVGLSSAEKLEAFKSLREAGLSSTEICTRLGWLKKDGETPQLNTYNKFKRIAGVPSDVQEAWKKYDNGQKHGLPFTPTEENLKTLEEAIDKDTANGFTGEVVNGPRYDTAYKRLVGNIEKKPPNYARKETMAGFAANLEKYPYLRMLMNTFAGKQTKHDVEVVFAAVKYIYDIGVGRDPGSRPAIMDMDADTIDPEVMEPETTDSVETDSVETDSVETDSVETDSVETDSVETDSPELVTAESAPTPRRKSKS